MSDTDYTEPPEVQSIRRSCEKYLRAPLQVHLDNAEAALDRISMDLPEQLHYELRSLIYDTRYDRGARRLREVLIGLALTEGLSPYQEQAGEVDSDADVPSSDDGDPSGGTDRG